MPDQRHNGMFRVESDTGGGTRSESKRAGARRLGAGLRLAGRQTGNTAGDSREIEEGEDSEGEVMPEDP
jgi:hypothetical protein